MCIKEARGRDQRYSNTDNTIFTAWWYFSPVCAVFVQYLIYIPAGVYFENKNILACVQFMIVKQVEAFRLNFIQLQ